MFTLASFCRRLGGGPSPQPGSRPRAAQILIAMAFVAGFGALTARMVLYASNTQTLPVLASVTVTPPNKGRPDIVDRHGRLLATDIRVYWLYANPQQLVNADEAAEKVAALFGDLNQTVLAAKFRNRKSTFEWVKRGLTPRQAEAVHRLGVPGFHIVTALQRVYPAGHAAAHILGLTNVDNKGISGIEKYIDGNLIGQVTPQANAGRPIVKLSIDLGVQHVLAEELARAKERYSAQAALGLILDVETGEVVASASLPDFDPNRRDEVLAETEHNRVVTHSYELGSVFKAFTIAMALDQGIVSRTDRIDAATPLKVGRFTLRDRYARREPMPVDDIFIQSSNTGTARLALAAGAVRQQQFLQGLGLFNRLETEAGVSRVPKAPRVWRPASAITIAYGHGIATPPLQFASAAAALVNGGTRIKPTFLLTSRGADQTGERVISVETSAAMRDLMRLTVLRGTGRRAAVPGVAIGGKTGTALKVKDKAYTRDVLNSFVAAFPIDKPKYLLLVTLDEPKPEKPGAGNDAGHNAAPAAGAIIQRVAPMLDIMHSGRFDASAPPLYERAGSPSLGTSFSRKQSHETGGTGQIHTAFGGRADPGRYRDFRDHGRQPPR